MGTSIRYRLFLHIAIVVTFLTGLNFAADKEDKNSDVKFTARTELVLVPTLVTDKSGAHITGLKKEDFTIRENGIEQKIATFEEITSNSHRLVRTSNPNEFTNSPGDKDSSRRITLIVLDFINTPFTDQINARKELLKYLTQSLDPREATALYTLTRDGVQVIHDFTSDPRVLIAALHKVKGDTAQVVDNEQTVEDITGTASPDGSAGVDPGTVQTEAAKLQTMMEDAELNFQSFQQRVAITYTLEGMQQIAQAVAGFPGRKSLIWAGGGFPFSVSDNTMQLVPAGRDSITDVLPLYERTWKLLNDAEIALYPIDVKGLQTNTASASVRNPGRNYNRNVSWRQLDTQSTLQTFAQMTGGRAYYNSNDLEKGFRGAVSDSAEYYLIGYYLDRTNTKSGWRKLAVKVDRDHVEVRGRSGFFVTHATTNPEISRNNDILSALRSPLDYTSLGLVARWDPISASQEPGKKHATYHLFLAVDPALIDVTDNNHLLLDFVALAKKADGTLAGEPSDKKVDIHVQADFLQSTQQKGVKYSGALDLAPGEYTVRFVVRDDINGRIGSVAAPLKIE